MIEGISAITLRAAERMPGHFSVIVRLLILTGMRRAECAALQTSWIQNETITLPKEVTKNGHEHTFPLCGGSIFTTSGNLYLWNVIPSSIRVRPLQRFQSEQKEPRQTS